MKRVAVISDLHCGHAFGLTPPEWDDQTRVARPVGDVGRISDAVWRWYRAQAKNIGRVDLLVVNGDAVDGRGEKSMGCELLVPDVDEQVRMAAACVREWDAAQTSIIAGTPYHTGKGEERERELARQVGGSFAAEELMRLGWCVMHAKHHIDCSRLWHTRATAVLREQLDQVLYASVGPGGDVPHIVVRSHAHFYVQTRNRGGVAIVTPALQVRSRFGRRIGGWSDVGVTLIEIGDAFGDVTVDVRLMPVGKRKARTVAEQVNG